VTATNADRPRKRTELRARTSDSRSPSRRQNSYTSPAAPQIPTWIASIFWYGGVGAQKSVQRVPFFTIAPRQPGFAA